MSYQKSHGLEMALNAVIKNFGVESLAADPSVTEAGRAWFNSTEKLFKFTGLDGVGAVVVHTFSSAQDLTDHINDLASQTTGDGAGLIGYDGHTGANAQFSVAAGTVEASLDSIVAGVDAEVQNRINAINAFTLQDAYDNDGGATANIQLATGKDFKILDDTDANVYFQVDAETGAVTITGDLNVMGTTTTVESTVNDADHWAITPGAAATVALAIEPDALVTPTADLINVKIANGGAAVFQVTADGSVLADGRDIAADGATLDGHLDGGAGKHAGTEISFNNVASGLTATTVQAAIDELDSVIGGADGTSLASQIDSLQTFTGSAGATDVDPAYSSVAYVTQGSSLTAAIGTLDAQLSTTNAAAVAAQSELDLVEAALGTMVGTDGNYVAFTTSNYMNGATDVTGALEALDSRAATNTAAIGTLSSLNTTDKSSAVAAVNEVKVTADAAVSKTALNAQKYRFSSGTPAVQHVVTHSLNSLDVEVTVWVKGDDLLWRNDLVPVTLNTVNQLTIDLTESRDVRVLINKSADL